ncbi:MAG: acyl-ACP--UDP-N-acetylglucosamine O-acyltransferase [Verrucomicrobia bacterium]|nr:MAG: acyl-ACP--UDP-N-acetylglucosamine O-acyltransferase [Verrucomicrobiota bacterium]
MTLHPSALISPEAQLADDVEVGPFAVIEGSVQLAAGVKIGGHAWLCGDTSIGEGSSIGWGSVIGANPQDLGFDPALRSGVRIGARNQIREYVTIHRSSQAGGHTTLGEGNYLMTGVHVGHDSQIGDGNVLANNVMFGGHVRLGNRAFLGGGGGYHQFLHIGDLAMVQGNAVVSQDVPPYCVAYGKNHLAGLNTVGLRRAGLDAAARAEIKKVYGLLFGSGLTLNRALEAAAAMDWSPAAKLLLDSVAKPSRKGVITERKKGTV